MGVDDNRSYILFYGISVNDWSISFGAIVDTHYLLVNEYISDGCDTNDSSKASDIHKFIYPHNIKKTYFIEGVVEGHITLASNGSDATINSYRVTLCKVHEDTSEEELKSTGWIDVNDTLTWDAGLSIGDERVYPFWIDVWDEQQLGEYERLYIKIEVDCDQYTYLMHSNDKQWEDIKLDIPFRL